ncbi:MAG: tetratricopeptide repeat protein [Treponema sp.]|jgi:putative GTP pyrophosphokinase|nr:tetratricopeptide repeat protein [Treponema sp.]
MDSFITEPSAEASKGRGSPPDRNSLHTEYDEYLPARTIVVGELEKRIKDALLPLSSRPRLRGRVKSFESYFRKYIRHLKSGTYARPMEVSDLIGVRVICPFLEDLVAAEELLKRQFHIIEVERKGGGHTFREFGYESIHLLVSVPDGIKNKVDAPGCEIAEIQIRSILQDVWAEVEHELVYKAEFTPFGNPLKRKLAAVNALLSLADIIFQDIRSYQRELNGELGKRRDSFFRKIEESTDAMLFAEEKLPSKEKGEETMPPLSTSVSIDDLLLEALSAHNKNQFSKAIAVYTRILEMKPDEVVTSLIYKHRGMAFFARSHYEEAIADFSESYRLDPKSYKAAYYEGVVCSVLLRYSRAVDAYNRSLEINQYQPYCLFRRGQAYYHMEDFPQALADCEEALALEPFEAAKKFKDLVLSKLKM